MTSPEIPIDPLSNDNELVTNDRMRRMMLFGIARGIIELLSQREYDDAVIELAILCETERITGTPPFLIDELAIGFVSRLDTQIYEDALVVQEILHPEMGTTIY